MDNEWVTPAELAARWRVSIDTIRRQLKSGEIQAMAIGASFRIHRDEIARRESPAIPAEAPPQRRASGEGSGLALVARQRAQKRLAAMKAAEAIR